MPGSCSFCMFLIDANNCYGSQLELFNNINLTKIFAGNPCPSFECWTFDSTTGKCSLRTDQGCFAVQCADSEIQLTFSPNLFGSSTNTFNDGGCAPTLANNQWTVNAGLGQCGMQVGTGMFDPTGSGATE